VLEIAYFIALENEMKFELYKLTKILVIVQCTLCEKIFKNNWTILTHLLSKLAAPFR
jgi:hypothetical protein